MNPNEKNLEKLQSILKLIDEGVRKADFDNFVKQILELLVKMEKRNSEAIANMEKTHAEMMRKMDETHNENYKAIRGQVNDLFVGNHLKRMDSETKKAFSALQDQLLKQVDSKLKDADTKVSSLKPIKGDKGDVGDPGPMPTEHLELMKEVKEELRKVKDILANIPRGKGMGRAHVQILRAQNLTSQVDGVVNTFTLDPDTTAVLGVFGTQFPVNFNAGTDWTFSGRTLTLVTAQVSVPQSGQTLWALTEVLFSP